MDRGRNCRPFLLVEHEDCPEIVDVGQRGAGYDLISECLEEAMAIIVEQHILGINA